MKLRRVISGGQTGADEQGLREARKLGLETGGTAPKGYRTERGNANWLKGWGLVESSSNDYAPRTRQNVLDADATVWFGNVGSPGYWCTSKAADNYKRPFFINPDAALMQEIAKNFEVINIAGNRESKNLKVCGLVITTFEAIKKLQLKEVSDKRYTNNGCTPGCRNYPACAGDCR